ncbi:MAG: hypothetical protein M3065_09935 [Actinomycetota bacterium]|nr:hypothetical protein [Actinomycetota bacterium]
MLVSGATGTGKSTLLGALAGDAAPTEGRRRVAPETVVVMLGQGREALTGPATIAARVRELTGPTTATCVTGCDSTASFVWLALGRPPLPRDRGEPMSHRLNR